MTFCPKCGGELPAEAAFCARCGAAIPGSEPPPPSTRGRPFIVTLMLCWSLGYLGVHRFYTGNTGIAVAQLLTCGGCGIWTLIDLIQILTGSYRDGEGQPLVHDE